MPRQLIQFPWSQQYPGEWQRPCSGRHHFRNRLSLNWSLVVHHQQMLLADRWSCAPMIHHKVFPVTTKTYGSQILRTHDLFVIIHHFSQTITGMASLSVNQNKVWDGTWFGDREPLYTLDSSSNHIFDICTSLRSVEKLCFSTQIRKRSLSQIRKFSSAFSEYCTCKFDFCDLSRSRKHAFGEKARLPMTYCDRSRC